MTFNRTTFFLLLFALITIPFAVYRILWLSTSRVTTGTMRFVGKDISGQLSSTYAVIRFFRGKDTFWLHGIDNDLYEKGTVIPVRYQKNDPSDARINTFSGMWVEPIMYATPFLLVILIAFLHPELVPRRSRIRLTARKPFMMIV